MDLFDPLLLDAAVYEGTAVIPMPGGNHTCEKWSVAANDSDSILYCFDEDTPVFMHVRDRNSTLKILFLN